MTKGLVRLLAAIAATWIAAAALPPALASAQAVSDPLAVPVPAPTDSGMYLRWTPWVNARPLPWWSLDYGLFGFDHGSSSMTFPLDARTLDVRVDAASGQIQTGLAAAEVPLGPARAESFAEYADRMTATNLRRQWVSSSRQRINQTPTDARGTTGGLSIALPVEMPKVVKSILGEGAPSLQVSGSERISIAGRSNWSNQQNVFGRKQSIFPQLDLRQDLDINVSGKLGDKVGVDISQFSGAPTPLANRIALRFAGEDDDVVRKLDIGNTQLTLPGTQYVSYSGRNDGLFGVMTQARFGEIDVSLIGSRQDARSERTSFTGSTQTRASTIQDWQYIQRTYFLLQLPDSVVDAEGDPSPDAPTIQLGSVQVYIDDRIDQDLGGEKPGYAEVVPPRDPNVIPPAETRLLGKFDRKEPIKDFEVLTNYFGERFPVLVLKVPVPEGSALAVAYTDSRGPVGVTEGDTLRLQLLKAPLDELPPDSLNTERYSDDPRVSPFALTREYELRNFYNLSAQNIDPKTAKIQVRRLVGGGQQEHQESFKDVNGVTISYLEVVGLDLLNQAQGGTPQPGQDGAIDYFADHSLVDWERGILYFPDLRPFAPRLDRPGDRYFYKTRIAPHPLAERRRTLSLEPGTPEELIGNDAPYMVRNYNARQDALKYVIYAELSTAGGSYTIYLRNTPIVEGSEIVTVNGESLVRERDYRINYLTGQVDLLSAKARDAGAQLNIDYSYAPLFSQATKTLLGTALKVIDRENYSLGGAFLYEARGQQEARPRLGEEPTRTMIGDVYGRLDIKPRALTSLVNLIPGYRTDAESRLEITAETGHSIPNPNTKNEVYLDDFEGTRNSIAAAIDARNWQLAAPPTVHQGAADVTADDLFASAELKWFNPYNVVLQRDLRPNLTRGEDSEASVNVLSWWIPRKYTGPNAPLGRDSLWVGLTQPLDNDGTDLSRSQFIDVWINDFRDFTYVRKPGVKLHIDIGVVSEDARLRPDLAPNDTLDTEDLPPADRQLLPEEDVGIDRVANRFETIVVDSTASLNASPSDPEGDNWQTPLDEEEFGYPERDPRRWRYANGTELNQQYRGIPDTEDLDADGRLDTQESFFRYTIELTDTTYLDTDVYEDFVGQPVPNPVQPDNGWRRYVIPLDDEGRQLFGNADLHTVKHVRVWLEGITDLPPLSLDPAVPTRPLFEIAQIEVVGNRWVALPVDSLARVQFGQNVTVRTVNTREDEAVYEPPFELDTQSSGGSEVEEREQSLALAVRNVIPGGRVSAYRPTTTSEDYSRYRALRFYAAGLDFAPEDSARFFVRFISDAGIEQRNYYEFSASITGSVPLGAKPVPWRDYELVLTDFSDLKLDLASSDSSVSIERPSEHGGTERLTVFGRPSFTRVQRIVVGVENASTSPDPVSGSLRTGELWIDELRAFDVDRDRGSAQRVTMVTNLADFASLSLNVDRQDENFLRLGQARGSGNNYLNWGLSGSTQLGRLLGTRAGFSLPLTFTFRSGKSVPLFRTGQDIQLRGDDSDSETSRNWGRTLSASFSHSGSRNPILRHTLDGIALRFSAQDDHRLAPTQTDTTRVLAGGGSYTLTPRDWVKWNLPVPKLLGKKPLTIYPLPASMSIGFDMSTRRSITYDRQLDGSLTSRLGTVYSKTALYNLALGWRPIEMFGYSVSSERNANLPGIDVARPFGVNFGRQTHFRHRFDGRLPVRFGTWLSPEFDGATSYDETRTPELSANLQLANFANTTTGNVRWTLPFTRLAARPGAARDTTGGGGIAVGKLLSRLGDVQLRGQFTRNTGYSRLTGHPSLAYRFGFAREPGFLSAERPTPSVFSTAQSTEQSTRNWLGEANTTLQLWSRANARVRASYQDNLRTSNTLAYATTTVTMPDVTADWGQFQQTLRLSKLFTTLTAQTRFSRQLSDEGLFGQPRNARTVSNNWQPLLSLNGTMRNGIQTVVAAEYRSSLRQDYRNAGTQVDGVRRSADTRTGDTNVRLELTKTLTPGQRFSFFGLFGSDLRSSLMLALRGTYNRRSGGTVVPGSSRVVGEIKNDRTDVSMSGTYQFSRNVSGTVGVGYNQYRDLTRQVIGNGGLPSGFQTQRGIRLEANAQMNF